jgi:serine/threonine protein kinase
VAAAASTARADASCAVSSEAQSAHAPATQPLLDKFARLRIEDCARPDAGDTNMLARFTFEGLSTATANFGKRLGGGGSGTVFQGTLIGTKIAVKRLKLAAESEAELALTLRHLHTEVRVLSEVHHPNIVPLLGWSNDGDAPCLVYALMVGGSLEDRLACEGGAAPLSSNERICVLSDVARGLAYLHSVVQIIHLDVKSANVLIDHGCVGRIGDFGVARSAKGKHGVATTSLQTGAPMGTSIYMSPECKNGQLSFKVDAFAFGLVVIEVLTGYSVLNPAAGFDDLHTMFEEDIDDAGKLRRHLDKRVCWDAHQPERIPALYSIAERCLEPRPKRRPQLVDLIPELEQVRRDAEVLAAEASAQSAALEEMYECVVCLTERKSHAMVPCGHACACEACASSIMASTRECPVCRASVSQALKIFF